MCFVILWDRALFVDFPQPQKKSHFTRDIWLIFKMTGVHVINNKERAGEYYELCLWVLIFKSTFNDLKSNSLLAKTASLALMHSIWETSARIAPT